MSNFIEIYKNYCDDLIHKNRYRKLNYQQKSSIYIDFSSNDYLCLSKNFDSSYINIEKSHQFGSTGSRLLSGNHEIFDILEKQIALDKNTESALTFISGYQANISTLHALLDEKILKSKPIVFFDKSNHASLYQGALSSGALIHRYFHSDLDHLESLLKKNLESHSQKFIVTESVFGMDGDISNIEKLILLAAKYNCFLYIDEAHATGVFGKHGYGLCSDLDEIYKKYNFNKNNILIMGTFSKGVGTSGAYVAGSETIINFLINKAGGFIYSTAMPPIIAEATYQNWCKIKNMTNERKRLIDNADYLRKKLLENNFDIGICNSQIISIIMENEEIAMNLKEFFLSDDKKILVSAIRPPTTIRSMIRIGLNAGHTREEIDFFVNQLSKFFILKH